MSLSPECWSRRWICLSSHISCVVHRYGRWDQMNRTGVKIKHQRTSQPARCRHVRSPSFFQFLVKFDKCGGKITWEELSAQVRLGTSLGPQGRAGQWGTSRCKVSSRRANPVASDPLMMNRCPSLCQQPRSAMSLPAFSSAWRREGCEGT